MPDAEGNAGASPSAFRVIRDPIHDYVQLPIALNELIDHPFMQRLRRIGQTAMSTSVFPAMTGTRFEHSLGTMHLARVAWQGLWSRTHRTVQVAFARDVFDDLTAHPKLLDDETNRWRGGFTTFFAEFETQMGLVLASAGLLHDIGHPPFSHSLEPFYERNLDLIILGAHGVLADAADAIGRHSRDPFHERVGESLLDELSGEIVSKIPWYAVRRVLKASRTDSDWAGALHGLLASEVDVDRLDYLIRDAKRAGTEFWSIDHQRLLDSLELHELGTAPKDERRQWTIGYGYRARTAIESLLTNRLRYYQWVLFHPHVAGANRFLDLALQELVDLGGLASIPTTDERDKEIAQRFERLRPGLNYFSHVTIRDRSASTGVMGEARSAAMLEDLDSIRLQGEVDDSTVVEWMKRSANLARLARSSTTVSGGLLERVDRYLSLYDAVLFRTPNWAPAWKTEEQFAQVAESLKGELLLALGDLRDEATRLTRESVAKDGEAVETQRVAVAAMNGLLEKLESSAVVGLNAVSWHLLHSSIPKVAARYHADIAKSILKAAPPSSSSKLRGGFWVLASGRVTATSEDGTEIRVWRQSDHLPLRDLSSMVAALPTIAASYPQMFAFFMVPDNEQMRVNRYSPHQADLRSLFVAGFPQAVRTHLLSRLRHDNR